MDRDCNARSAVYGHRDEKMPAPDFPCNSWHDNGGDNECPWGGTTGLEVCLECQTLPLY